MQQLLTYANYLIELSGAIALTATALAKLTSRWPKVSAFLSAFGHDLSAAKDALKNG